MHQFTRLQDLSTNELLELLYYIEGLKVEKEEFFDFYNNLSDIQKSIWVNTDVEERKIRDTIEKFLLVSEKESLTQLYKLSEKRLSEIRSSLENIRMDKRFRKFGVYIFQTDIRTLPIKIKQLDLGDIDKISEVKLSDLEKQLNDVEFKIAQKGAVKARADLKLRNVPKITAVKGQIATRVRDFTTTVGANIQTRLKAEILEGIKAGEGTSDIARRIRSVYKKPVPITVKPQYRDGKLIRAGYSYEISNKRWSEMVARSESSWSVNQGRVEAYKSSGLVRNVEWQTAGDPCPDCAIMEGQILELFEAENIIPYHVHCKCTWTVNTYKSVDEKLPEPPTQFSDELYDKPDGIGIAGIMKMSPGNQRIFNRALELGNYKQAEKLMRHTHIRASMIDLKGISKIPDDALMKLSFDGAVSRSRAIIHKLLGTTRTLKNGGIIKIDSPVMAIGPRQASRMLGQPVSSTGAFYVPTTDRIYIILEKAWKDLTYQRRFITSNIIHEVIHSYGNHFGGRACIEGLTSTVESLIARKAGLLSIPTGEYKRFADGILSLTSIASNKNVVTVKSKLQQYMLSKNAARELAKDLAPILKRTEGELVATLFTKGPDKLAKQYSHLLSRSELSQIRRDLIRKSIENLQNIVEKIMLLGMSPNKQLLDKLIKKLVDEYMSVSKEDQEEYGLTYSELLAFWRFK